MNWVVWAMILMAAIIIIFVILGIIFAGQNNQANKPADPSQQTSLYVNLDTWSIPVPSGGTGRNVCSLYTFPGQMQGSFAVPGEPTLNFDVLNSLTPNPVLPSCVDVDQIAAQQVTHTCNFTVLGVTGASAVSWCYETDGTLASPGTTETFYQNCGNDGSSSNIPACAGELALVSLNYTQTTPGMTCPQGVFPQTSFCIQGTGGTSLALAQCDISNENQLFRVVRSNPGNPDPNLQSNSGILAQLFDRNNNLCIVPGVTGSTGNAVAGTPAILGTCSPNIGTVWALIPSFSNIDGQPVSGTGHTGCTAVGQTGCIAQSPPQMAYIGGITQVPQLRTVTDVINFINNNNIMSLTASSPTGGPVFVSPYSFNQLDPTQHLSSSQYINYALYNVINTNCYNTPYTFLT